MYKTLRLTELHEEWAHHAFAAHDSGLEGLDEFSDRYQREADRIDAEIRARVARHEIRPAIEDTDFGPIYAPAAGSYDALLVCDVTDSGYRPWPYLLLRHRSTERVKIEPAQKLRHGTPDAERIYPRKAVPSLKSWLNHAVHNFPVEGCHLCQEPRVPVSACRDCGHRTYDDLEDCPECGAGMYKDGQT